MYSRLIAGFIVVGTFLTLIASAYVWNADMAAGQKVLTVSLTALASAAAGNFVVVRKKLSDQEKGRNN